MDPNVSTQKEGQESSPILNFDIVDSELISYLDKFEDKANKFFNDDKKLDKRREVNRRFFFGNQLQGRHYHGLTIDRKLKSYEKPYIDNVLKEGEDILRPLVLSRLPDLMVNPGTESQIPRESADSLSEAVNKTLHSDELKKILTKAFRNHPIDLTAVIKWRWDPNKGKLGDIQFEFIPAKNIIMDFRATENDERQMRIIIHFVEKSLYEWIMLFPKKESELQNFATDQGWKKEDDKDGRSFDLKVRECWCDWQDKVEDFNPEDPKFDFKTGVIWKLGKGENAKILDKRLDPNWDWEGEDKVFYNGQPVPDELMPQLAMLGFNVPGVEIKKVFKNYFGTPRKPFIFMGYEQYGEMPIDETSRIEDNIILQENYDIRGMQITKMIDDAKGKNVYSSLSGLKKETVDNNDPNNPDQDMFLTGELSKVHTYIKKEQPSDAMFGDLGRTRERMLSKLHISAPTRGEIKSDTATTNQIARESDFSVADDISDLTINEVTTKMAEALLQLMKLRYTPQHFERLIGKKGDDLHDRLTSDIIEDGMEVSIHASGTDKLKAERQAKEEAQLGLGDPVSYYKDTGRSDAKTRAEMGFLYKVAPALYYKLFIKNQSVENVANEVTTQNQKNLSAAQGQSTAGPMEVNTQAMSPSPTDTTNIPTTPQGSPRGLIGKAVGAIGKVLGR